MTLEIFIGLVAFIGILVAIGALQLKKVTSENQYLLAGRQTGLFALIATLVMTEFNTTTLIAFSGAGIGAGWWGLALPFIFFVGLLFYGLTVAKKWKNFNGVSVAHFFTQRYGKDIGALVAVILFSAMAMFSATYVKSLTLMFLPLFPDWSPWTLSAVLVGSVLLMTLRGGLVSIIRTDLVSFVLACCLMPLLFLFVAQIPESAPAAPMSFAQMQMALPVEFVFSLIVLTMFSYIIAPWYGQKIVSAKSPSIARSAVLLSALFVFVLYGIGVLSVYFFSQKGYMSDNPELSLPYLLNIAVPQNLQGIYYGLFFAIAATTLSGVWSAMVTLVVGKRLEAGKEGLKRSMSLMLLCAFLSYALGNGVVDSVLNKMILANIPVVALAFALLGGFYWKKTSRVGVYASIAVGLAVGTTSYLYYGEAGLYTWYWAVYGVPLIFLSGIVGSILFPEESSTFSGAGKAILTGSA
ncbi:MAG: hypothetical protein HOI80_04555 [Alphaproteobacteria bacterium]|nr:hypothetical protein [Alphaproteobacteria bacterium]